MTVMYKYVALILRTYVRTQNVEGRFKTSTLRNV